MDRYFVSFDGTSAHIITEHGQIKTFRLEVTENVTTSESSVRDYNPGDLLFVLAGCVEDQDAWKRWYCSYADFQTSLINEHVS